MKKDIDVAYIVRGIIVVTKGGSVENIPDPGRGGSGGEIGLTVHCGIYTVNFGGIWD